MEKSEEMATFRGFTLEKLSDIKIIFSTFDSRAGAARYDLVGPLLAQMELTIALYAENFLEECRPEKCSRPIQNVKSGQKSGK